jgi:hypothetical protein
MDTQVSNYESDIIAIVARRFDNGGDLWATVDKRIAKGSAFSTLSCALILTELGVADNPIMKEIAELIFSCWKEDGRFKIAPKGAIYPCQVAGVARVLCTMGYSDDFRIKKTMEYLLQIQYGDGGWRCNTFKYGRGPETMYSNPGTTLEALDVFRFSPLLNREKHLDRAVEFLLDHWETRKPIGPCLYGIGTLFMKIEYPMFRYNLLFYVHVLSYYNRAKKDKRFLEALNVLKSKLSNGKLVVENPNKKLESLSFCRKGEPSELATKKYYEILDNLEIEE